MFKMHFVSCRKFTFLKILAIWWSKMHDFQSIFELFRQFPTVSFNSGLAHYGSWPFKIITSLRSSPLTFPAFMLYSPGSHAHSQLQRFSVCKIEKLGMRLKIWHNNNNSTSTVWIIIINVVAINFQIDTMVYYYYYYYG